MTVDKQQRNAAQMNELLRASGHITGIDSAGPAQDGAVNNWFRASILDARQARVNALFGRLIDAHEKQQAWERGDDSEDTHA